MNQRSDLPRVCDETRLSYTELFGRPRGNRTPVKRRHLERVMTVPSSRRGLIFYKSTFQKRRRMFRLIQRFPFQDADSKCFSVSESNRSKPSTRPVLIHYTIRHSKSFYTAIIVELDHNGIYGILLHLAVSRQCILGSAYCDTTRLILVGRVGFEPTVLVGHGVTARCSAPTLPTTHILLVGNERLELSSRSVWA